MKWCFIFSVSFLLVTSKIQSCVGPENKTVLSHAVKKILANDAAKQEKGINKILVRTISCELPTIADDRRGRGVTLDVNRLQENEYPFAKDFNHPGRKLVGRADSPKGSPRDPSKLQRSVTSTSEDEFPEEEDSPISITQRRSTFSE